MGCKHFAQHLLPKKIFLDKYNKNNNSSKVQSRCLYSRVYVFVYATYMWLLKKKFKQKEKFQQSVVTRASKMESAAGKKDGSEQQIKNQQKFPFAFILYDLKHISHFTIFLSFSLFFSSHGLCGAVADEMKRGKKNCFKVFLYSVKINI